MIVVKFDEPQEYHAPNQETRRARVFIDEEKLSTAENVMGMSIYGPGTSAPFHHHQGSETIFILHGRGKFRTRQREVEAQLGDGLYFPGGEEHSFENTGSQTLEFIFVYSRPGDEKPIKEKWIPLKE